MNKNLSILPSVMEECQMLQCSETCHIFFTSFHAISACVKLTVSKYHNCYTHTIFRKSYGTTLRFSVSKNLSLSLCFIYKCHQNLKTMSPSYNYQAELCWQKNVEVEKMSSENCHLADNFSINSAKFRLQRDFSADHYLLTVFQIWTMICEISLNVMLCNVYEYFCHVFIVLFCCIVKYFDRKNWE